MSFHVMTHVVGVVIVLGSIVLFALCVHSYRAWRTHVAAEKAAFHARGASALSIVALGMTLPTLLRIMAFACCIAGAFCASTGLVISWLVVDPERDAGLRAASPFADPAELGFTPEGQLCMAAAKLGPSSYAVTKTFSYLFFFLKSRTVRPTERMGWVYKIVLFLTLQLFVFAASAVWLVNGDVNALDNVCAFHIPLWMILMMASADFVFEAIYLALFVHPLYETIRANRALRIRSGAAANGEGGAVKAWAAPAAGLSPTNAAKVERGRVAPVDSAVADNAASARGSALERVLRRNMHSCAVSTASSLLSLGFVVVAHVTDNAHLRKACWLAGVWDVTVANLCIAHLMLRKETTVAAASTAGPSVPQVTVVASDAVVRVADPKSHKYRESSAPGRQPPPQPSTQQQLSDPTHTGATSPTSQLQLCPSQGSFGSQPHSA